MRKLLFILPVAAAALFLTGCDEVSYRERTVVRGGPGYHGGPAYYGDDDMDFYYVSTRPYSRSYGQLYLRDGRYYYSRGGSYHVYSRPTYTYDRYRTIVRERERRGDGRDRRDWDRDRDRRDWDGRRDRDVERVRVDRVDRRDRDRDFDGRREVDGRRDIRRDVEVRNRQTYNVRDDRVQAQRVRVGADGAVRVNQRVAGSPDRVQVTQGGRQPRAERAVYRQTQREDGDRRERRNRDDEREQ